MSSECQLICTCSKKKKYIYTVYTYIYFNHLIKSDYIIIYRKRTVEDDTLTSWTAYGEKSQQNKNASVSLY